MSQQNDKSLAIKILSKNTFLPWNSKFQNESNTKTLKFMYLEYGTA